MRKLELTRRMMAWFVELSEFDIQYKPCGPIKTQFMTNFLVEFDGNDTTTPDWCTLYVGGASNIKGSRAGIIKI